MSSGIWLAAAIFASLAFAEDPADRAKLPGKWQQEAASAKDGGAVWILENKDSGLHVTELQNGDKVADFSCNTMGKECKIKDAGRDATVSFWFDGPKLVQMETRGSDVTKRLFSIAGQPDSMQLEIVPIVPAGKPEVIKFSRVQEVAAQ